MRPSNAPYRGRDSVRIESFFENLLPDNAAIRDRIRHRFSLPSTKAFDLLSCIGRDCAGALQILPDGETPKNLKTISGETVADDKIENILRDIVRPDHLLQNGQSDDEFRISIAGAQEKTALLFHEGKWNIPHGSTPTTHILKLPIGQVRQGIELTTSVSNEWLCLMILKEYGLSVNAAEIKQFGTQEVLVVERFDRRFADDLSWIIRLPQEDFCQATGTPPDKKYEYDGGPGIKQITDILLGSSNFAEDRILFMKAQVLFWMLCAIDGHAKNFSIHLLPNNDFALTPLYDVMSAFPYLGKHANNFSPHKVKMAMAVEGQNRHYGWNEIQYRHWLETGKKCSLEGEVRLMITDLIFKTSHVIDSVKQYLPSNFPGQVAETILDGLQESANKLDTQRRGGLMPIPAVRFL